MHDNKQQKRRDTVGQKRKRNVGQNLEEEREPKRIWDISTSENSGPKETENQDVPHNFKMTKPSASSVSVKGGKQIMCFDPEHSAPQVQFLNPGCSFVTNAKGYRMARSSHGVSSGTWYWEAKIEPPSHTNTHTQAHSSRPIPDPHWRLGWATMEAQVQAPVGYDKYSYGYRDMEGVALHMAKRIPYGSPYQIGDVIGFMIILPEIPLKQEEESKILSETSSSKKEEDPEIHPGSKIIFFKNGVSQGIAFENIIKGTYYPAVSLYFNASVLVGFGPDFVCPPKTPIPYLPLSYLVESTLPPPRQGRKKNEGSEGNAMSPNSTTLSAAGALMGLSNPLFQ